MRLDMAKVVTERPRRGHGNLSRKTSIPKIRRYDADSEYEDLPTRAPVSAARQYGWDKKSFSDLLGPLQSYLRAQVGRPWDKVYSELSQNLDRRSMSGRHIWTHVWQEVMVDCHLEADGKVYPNVQTRYSGPRRLEGLYVHPITGLLCHKPRKRHRYRAPKGPSHHQIKTQFNLPALLAWRTTYYEPFVPENWIIVDDLTLLERRNDIWFVHTFRALDPNQVIGVVDVDGKEKTVYLRDRTKFFKARVKMQQLGRKHPLWSRVKNGNTR